MMRVPSGKQVSKNASFLTGAYVVQKLLAFVYFTLIARWIAEDSVGKYVFAISLTTIFSIFIDLGLTSILIRETARAKDKITEYLNQIVSIKLPLAVLAYVAAIITVHMLGKDPLTTTMVYLSGALMIFDSFTLSFWGVFRGQQNLRYESITIIINQILILSVGLGGIILKYPVWVLVLGLLAGSFISFVVSLYLIKTKLKHKFKLILHKPVLKHLFILAAPFALAGIFTRVYSYIDQVMLSTMIGDTQLGWYSVAYKITFALQFIPAAFAASIYPAMSNYFEHAKDKLARLFEKSMYLLLVVALPITFGTIAVSNELITIVYTDRYMESILPLQILIAAMPAIFMAFPVGAMLNSCNKQHINTANLGITMLINIVMNVIMIPLYAHVGAAIAASVSLYYLFLSNLYFVRTITPYKGKYLLISLIKSLIASIIMAIAVKTSIDYVGLVPAILVGVFTYPIALLLLKGVEMDDVVFIRKNILSR